MDTFSEARKKHSALDRAARGDAATAGAIWAAIVEQGDPEPGTMAEAVRDTRPLAHAALVATNPSAAVMAFAALWDAPRHGRTGHERREHARAAWAAFGEAAERAEDFREGFGWDLSLAWEHARDVSPRDGEMVARIAKLAGRMYAALKGAKAERVPGLAGEVHSVELGGAVERLLPGVYAQLLDEHLELPALYDVSIRRAPQYAVRGTERRSRGPLVLVLDESGSMHGARNEWAKAAAIAVARVAAAEKRKVSVVHYSTSIAVVELRPSDPASVLAMVKHFLSGGTDIGLALGAAVAEVKRLAARGDQGADLLAVTDGIDAGSAPAQLAALDAAKALGARLWTVAIECEIAAGDPLRARAAGYAELGRGQLADGASVAVCGGAVKA